MLFNIFLFIHLKIDQKGPCHHKRVNCTHTKWTSPPEFNIPHQSGHSAFPCRIPQKRKTTTLTSQLTISIPRIKGTCAPPAAPPLVASDLGAQHLNTWGLPNGDTSLRDVLLEIQHCRLQWLHQPVWPKPRVVRMSKKKLGLFGFFLVF